VTLDPDAVPRKSFETSFRGYDPMEVQAFLLVVADELRAARDRELDLELHLSEAERRAREARDEAARRLPPAPPPPPAIDELDNAEIARLIGEETARVLESARSAADEIRRRAETDAESVLAQASERARARVALAEQEAADAHEVAASILAEARAEADEVLLVARSEADELLAVSRREAHDLVAGARETAEELLDTAERDAVAARAAAQSDADELVASVRAQADADAAAMVDEAGAILVEARERRRTILEDLSARRRQALAQLEQLRAGRDHLARALDAARSTLDDLATGVEGALEGARQAAHEARARIEAHPPQPITDELPDVTADAFADEGGPADHEGGSGADGNGADGNGADRNGADRNGAEGNDGREPEILTSLFARIRADQEAFVGTEYPDVHSSVHGHDGSVDLAGADRVDGMGDGDDEGPDVSSRDRALAGAERGLGRALKRVLSEEQNQVLDGVRSAATVPALDDVVGGVDTHALRYAAAARTELREAVSAGARFAGGGGQDGRSSSELPASDDLAAQLSVDIVSSLRDHLGSAWAQAGDDQLQLLERLRPIYRSWRGRQLPELAQKSVAEAFNRGLSSVPGADVDVWLVPVP
jgi:DivIVA domain-containing protein